MKDGSYSYSLAADGYKNQVNSKVQVSGRSQLVKIALEAENNIARVSSAEELAVALGDYLVNEIHIVGSLEINEDIDKTIVLPEGINGITLKSNEGRTIENLIVRGNNNRLEDLKINKLIIDEKVDNLALKGIKDSEESDHIFAGGGGNSITLHGETIFTGNIKITSGSEIQIRSESEGAKIEGRISVESSTKTTIAAPVSNLVINSDNTNIVINSRVDSLEVRKDAKIIVKKGIENPTIKARPGTSLEAKNEEGEEVEIEISYVLDYYDLDKYIKIAEFKHKNTIEGNFDGNVASGAKDALEAKIDAANSIKGDLKNLEANGENQNKIDQASKELISAIEDFDSKIITVDKRELNNFIRQVDRFLNQIEIGPELGNYPEDAHREFLGSFNKAKDYLQGAEVSQEGNDEHLRKLEKSFDKFKASKIANEESRGEAGFTIKGDFTGDEDIKLERVKGLGIKNDRWGQLDAIIRPEDIEISKEKDRIDIEIKFNNLSQYSEFILPFNMSKDGEDYLGFLSISSEEIKNKTLKEIKLDEFKSIELGVDETTISGEQRGSLYLLDEQEEDISSIDYRGSVKALPGKYSISYLEKEEEIQYYIYSDIFTLTNEDEAINFAEDQLIDLQVDFTQDKNNNYTRDSIFLAKYDSSHGVSFPAGTSLKVNKGFSGKMIVEYKVKFNGEEYIMPIHHQIENGLESDSTIEINDDFGIVLNNNDNKDITLENIDQYLKIGVRNTSMQEIYTFYRLNTGGGYDYSYSDGYKIEVKDDKDGSTIFNEVYRGREINNLKYSDLIGERDIEKFTMEISMPDIPLVEKSIFNISIGEKQDNIY